MGRLSRLLVAVLVFAVGAVVVNPAPSIAGPPTQNVQVVNTAPVPTRDADNPARQPFHATRFFSMTTGEPDQTATIPVPAGKRLIIEHVSAFSQPARFYADPETEIVLGVVRTTATGTAAGQMTVSGHLVSVP
jgi:hypothetical protein